MSLLLPHQLEAFRKMHNGCILKGATGSGKTMTALAYYCDADPVERLIVITTARKRDDGDWQAEARLFGVFPEVQSWQNIGQYENVANAFFIFDEQRLVGAGPWVKSFLKIARHNQWVMLTATPGDTWMDYIPVFVANGFYANRTQFLTEHAVYSRWARYPKVDRWIGEQRLERCLRKILIEMDYKKHTTWHEIDLFCEYDRDLYDTAWRKRWNFEEERPIRNGSERCALVRKVVNSDPTRLANVRKVLADHPRLIVFYNFDYELEILRTLCNQNSTLDMDREKTGGSSGLITATAEAPGSTSMSPIIPESFALAEWNRPKHQKVPSTDAWIYLVQYTAGAEAWNCTATDAILFYSLTYSYRMFKQAHGRIDRLDTKYTDLYYYTLRSASKIDAAVFDALARKENFNEMRFLRES